MAHTITHARALDIGAGWIAPSNPGLTCFTTYGYGHSHVPDDMLPLALEEAEDEHGRVMADLNGERRFGWTRTDERDLAKLVRYLRAEATNRGLT